MIQNNVNVSSIIIIMIIIIKKNNLGLYKDPEWLMVTWLLNLCQILTGLYTWSVWCHYVITCCDYMVNILGHSMTT